MERRYNGPGNGSDYASAIAVDSAGNAIVTGQSVGSGGNNDYYTAKYAVADGALLWERRYNAPTDGDDSARAVVVDSAGNAIVTGFSDGHYVDYYTAKYAAANGSLLWEKRYSSPRRLRLGQRR